MYRIRFFIAFIFEENKSNKKSREATGINYKGFSFKKRIVPDVFLKHLYHNGICLKVLEEKRNVSL